MPRLLWPAALAALLVLGGGASTVAQPAPAASAAPAFPLEFMRQAAWRRAEPGPSVRAIRSLLAQDPAAAALKDRVEPLLLEAEALAGRGQGPEAQRRLVEARAILRGQAWTPAQAFASSLDLRAGAAIVDTARPLPLRISQAFPQAPAPGLRLRLSLQAPGEAPAPLADLPAPRLRGQALTLPVALAGAGEGRRTLLAEVVDGGTVLATATSTLDLVADLGGREAAVRRRLATVTAGEAARASVLYPFELAGFVQSGRREPERLPFAARLARSEAVLAGLERGQDIVVRGTGDQARHYQFAEAGEIMPYRLYVPTDWDGREALPMAVVLHGGGGDENEMFNLDDGKLGKLAQRYRYIVVAPFGYRPVGAYGSPIRLPSVYGNPTREGRDVGGPERARMLKLSEQDVLNVLELTAREYGADRSRVFLTGHSMGGGGTWYLAHQHRQLWAGAAASAGPFFIDGYDFERLRGLPLLIAQGDADPPSLEPDRQLAADLLKRGIGVTYLETAGVNHGQTFGASLPSIFEFFERQKLKADPRKPLPFR
ncbi:hypothetical protein [Phenylobacterium sp. J367]|uniref:carboxylesterase family protein n=1 Tax=Phenylobacterium sp. J367 TaxID=2898435 RepID=UPI0027E2F2EB|nr:hypothetical protein [Phenylobacterium sp. J367]